MTSPGPETKAPRRGDVYSVVPGGKWVVNNPRWPNGRGEHVVLVDDDTDDADDVAGDASARLIAGAHEAVCVALKEARVTRSELARRLGKSPGHVTQVLADGRNMTLRTLAELADALGYSVSVEMKKAP